jgi:hypothetical protein
LIANIPKLLAQFDQSDLPVGLAVIEGDAKVCGEAQHVVLTRNEPVDLSPWLGLRDTAISFLGLIRPGTVHPSLVLLRFTREFTKRPVFAGGLAETVAAGRFRGVLRLFIKRGTQ